MAAFPNPSTGNFTLQFVGQEMDTKAMHLVDVIDALGNKVAQRAFSGAFGTVQLDLSSGVYLLHDITNPRIQPVRLVIH